MTNIRIALLALTILFAHSAAHAQQVHPMLTDTHRLTLGMYFPDTETTIGINGSSDVDQVEFDFEGELAGSDSDETFAGTYVWKFGDKWDFQAQYFDSSRKQTATLEQDVEWGDYVLEEGSNLSAGLDLTVLRAFFGREFSRGDKHVFGAGIGVHWMEIEVFAEGEFFLDGESTGFRRESVGAEAPLPNIGAWYLYSPSPKWAIAARLDWLDASIDEYSGGLVNASLGVNYQLFDNFGIGANYQYFTLDGDVDKGSWNGSVELDFQGPLVYASFNW